ncbi:MAG TPA: hypothetical protein VGC84_19480, partial [Ilumatobacteraceae bacterium]
MLWLFFEIVEWTIKLTILLIIVTLKAIVACYRTTLALVHGYRSSRDRNANPDISQLIAGTIVAGVLGLVVLIGSIADSGSTSSASQATALEQAAETTTSSTSDTTAPVVRAAPSKAKRHMRITSPAEVSTVYGRPIGSFGERRALVRVEGRAEPGASVYVDGGGDGGSPHDDATVTVNTQGRWHARIDVYGCGPSDSESTITSGYDESYADDDTVTVDMQCGSRPASSPQAAPTPPVTAPAPLCDSG